MDNLLVTLAAEVNKGTKISLRFLSPIKLTAHKGIEKSPKVRKIKLRAMKQVMKKNEACQLW